MKKLGLFAVLLLGVLIGAQIPSGYYDGTDGLSGAQLKTKLSQIINNGAQDKGYSALLKAYKTTDVDNYYEKDGTVLDIYSENPKGTDPYEFSFYDACGNYKKEGDCYNREHIVPQSFFNKKSPMRNDVHFIVPTDGKVNAMRSDFPYGIVKNPTWISRNGSKLGNNSTPGYSGVVFEPIDEFKGDVARMILYFVTRYEDKLREFKSGNILSTNKAKGLQDWELNVLLKWNQEDRVSKKEIDRNNAAYKYQHNRNPFIDHPEFVEKIWGKSNLLSTKEISYRQKLLVHPNPVKNGIIYLTHWEKGDRAEVFTTSGQKVLSVAANGIINVKSFPKGLYILRVGSKSTKILIQ
ncbi:endonuclease [Riemerella columbipharyngis]|uniref:Por secretion system C-terminal sorting domain-containing protein n=1 Tax=Riemerella columbipharyngis TaxID=1071918 RepID=A0A1G7AYG3_9FLAO|nr:endonuclease [Riemerella columbipharyngis]SDE19823.1 Por secretion system C-terminal sorting domain-containing protein [Riemerella columbipharyngis]